MVDVPFEEVKDKRKLAPGNRNMNLVNTKGKRDERKGGKSVSPWGVLKQTLGRRTKCDSGCTFFEQCPVCAMSVSWVNPKTGEKNKCLMKEFPETVKVQFVNLFLTGEEGIIKAIKTALHNYMNDVDAFGSLKDKKDMIQLMLQFYKEVYNSSRTAGKAKEPLTITIRRVGLEPQTVNIMSNEPLPEGVSRKELLMIQNGDITEGDPESLVNSPIFDQIVNRKVTMEEIKIETNIEQFIGEDDGVEE